MSNPSNSLDRIEALKAEIASLESAALKELKDRRSALASELASVDAELARMTGKPLDKGPKRTIEKQPRKSIPLQELKEMLANAPDKTIGIRKEGLDLSNIKTLANANPGLLQIGNKGPWPTVTLLR